MIEKQKIREFLVTLIGKDVQFDDDDSLLTNQLIDSLNVAQLVAFLEQTFNLSFESEDISPENLDSVNAITRFLEQKGASENSS
jgi:acyl carrier protein